MNNVFLTGDTIYLRPLSSSDLTTTYLSWLNDEEVCRYNSHATFPYTEAKMKDFFESLHKASASQVVCAIIDKETETHIGNISLQGINWISRSAEFAILVGDKRFWGKGIGREAGLLLCAYGFNRLNLHRIYCGTSRENTGMQKLAAALKMQQEGTRRQAMYKNGRYTDIFEYGVLCEEFFN